MHAPGGDSGRYVHGFLWCSDGEPVPRLRAGIDGTQSAQLRRELPGSVLR